MMDSPAHRFVHSKVYKFPKYKHLKPDYGSEVSPLEFFYRCFCGHYIPPSLGIDIDGSKVAISSVDAVFLFACHRDWIVFKNGEEGKELAADIWESMGPMVLKEVPMGLMFVAPGLVRLSK